MSDPHANWKQFVEVASLSDIGLRRTNNQDSLCVVLAGSASDWRQRGHVLMVADGMGAHAAGELASRLACGGVPHAYRKVNDKPAPDALRQAIQETNNQIHSRGQANAEFHGMGTTCSVLVLLPEGAIAGHVGDSRVYRLRGDKLDQLTFDHSLVWELMAAGQTSGANANLIPKNIITRSLGPHAEVQVDLEGPFAIEVGDIFLLCSDGLTGQVQDGEIAAALASMSPTEAAQALIDLANLRGGPDNISVVIAKVKEPVPATTAEAEPPGPPLSSRLSTIHPGVWVGIVICVLAGLGLAFFGNLIPALVCEALAAVAAIFAFAQAAEQKPATSQSYTGGPLGKGPHTTLKATVDEKVADNFAKVADDLRRAAADEGWMVDWQQFNLLIDQGKTAVRQKQYQAGVRQFLLAVSFLMREIRRHRRSTGDTDPANVIG